MENLDPIALLEDTAICLLTEASHSHNRDTRESSKKLLSQWQQEKADRLNKASGNDGGQTPAAATS